MEENKTTTVKKSIFTSKPIVEQKIEEKYKTTSRGSIFDYPLNEQKSNLFQPLSRPLFSSENKVNNSGVFGGQPTNKSIFINTEQIQKTVSFFKNTSSEYMHDLAKDKNQSSAKSSNQLEENKTPPLFGSALSQGIIKFEDQKNEPEVATLHKREVSLEKSKPKVLKEVVVVKLKPEQREEIKILKPFKINSCLIDKIEEALKCQFCHCVIDLEQNLMCSQCSITWCKKCINMSIKINNKCPNCRTKLIEYEMNENCLLNKFVKSINQMKENKSEFQCMIHLLRIKYFCTDCDSYLCSKCILSDAHEAHNLTPISKMYEDKVKQSSQISVQIDECVNKLQESVSFIDNTKKLTLSKVQSKFDNFLNIVFEQRDILKK